MNTEDTRKEKRRTAVFQKKAHPRWDRILSLVLVVVLAYIILLIFQTATGKKNTYSSKVTELGFKNVGELVTQEGSYTAVQSIKGARKEFGITFPFTDKLYIYSMDGVVQAGVDFAQIEVKEDFQNKVLNVSLPPAKILAIDPDRDSFTVFYESNNMFNALHLEDTNEAERAAEKEIREKAENSGILEHATYNAKTLISAMLYQVYDQAEWKIAYEVQKEE